MTSSNNTSRTDERKAQTHTHTEGDEGNMESRIEGECERRGENLQEIKDPKIHIKTSGERSQRSVLKGRALGLIE